MIDKTLWLIRGVPGTGKSTLASMIAFGIAKCGQRTRTAVLEANDYFLVNGEFKFDATRVRQSFEWCQIATDKHMREGTEHVFVTNPFTKIEHLRPYEQLAALYGYKVNVITCHNWFGNPHAVPVDTLRKMRDSMEYPATALPA